jgi:hypothetical protein
VLRAGPNTVLDTLLDVILTEGFDDKEPAVGDVCIVRFEVDGVVKWVGLARCQFLSRFEWRGDKYFGLLSKSLLVEA